MQLDSYPAGLLIVLCTASLAVATLLSVRKLVSHEMLRQSHEVAGYLLALVGTMYAVLLGLVVVDAMNKFDQARVNTQSEANSLADIFLLAERFPKAREHEIKDLCVQYAQRVTDVEWALMDDAKIDQECSNTAIKLMRVVQRFEPVTQAEVAMYPVAVQQVCSLWDCRRTRTNSAVNGIPFEEWIVLLVGGGLTILFISFFNLENVRLQTIMTVMVAILIALNLLLVLWFGYPFSGDRKVHADAFQVDMQVFRSLSDGNHDAEKPKQ